MNTDKNSIEKKNQPSCLAAVSSNCEKCAFFRYEASWGHGWCDNDNSQYSGKLRGNGTSCNLNTSKR